MMTGHLHLSADAARELLDAAADRIQAFHRDLDEGVYPASYVHDSLDAAAYEDGRKAAAALREDEPPAHGTDSRVLLDELFDQAMTNGTMHPHPGFMAHVPSGGLFAGAVGDLVARAVNRFAGVWLAAPGYQQIESNVITWFCRMLGYGDGSFGYLTTGGSIANFMALYTALSTNADTSTDSAVVYVSAQGHFSVAKAANLAGIPPRNVRVIGTHADLAMDVDLLAEAIAQDRAAGLSPVCVVSTAGTTNSGAIDPLRRITEICAAEGIWSHVDACFGGFFRITDRGRASLEGVELADSIAVDAHKSLFLPHGISALLVRNRISLRDAFQVPGAAYLPGFIDEPGLVDFCNYGPELSREIRGLTAWLPLKMHGLDAFRACLDEKLDLAEYLADHLSRIPGIEVVQRHPRHLPVVNFRLARHDNARLCELICAQGAVYLTTTRLPDDGLVVRVCILHHQTGKDVVTRLIDDVKWAVSELTKSEE